MRSVEAEVMLVGAGPAGIAAACAVSESGLAVTVVDDNPAAGGQIWRTDIPDPWRDRFRAEVIANTRVVGQIEPGVLLAESPTEALALRYRKLILAPGARELLLPFPGWTRPNVVAAGGLQALVKGGLPIEDKRVVLVGTGPLLLAVEHYLRKCGARVYRGPRVVTESIWREPFDYLAFSFGLMANLELPMLMGCQVRDGQVTIDEWQKTSRRGIYHAGRAGGVGLALAEGQIAGYACAGRKADALRFFPARTIGRWLQAALDRIFPVHVPQTSPDTIICRCEDVTLGALTKHDNWRSAKLETRCGMGPCQGRICGPAVQRLLGWKAESVRPPIFPARVETLAAIHWKDS
jgi:NADPH-dependent 2,4-dienoyl-CoA reductase/sulfur reductase-like enzyme